MEGRAVTVPPVEYPTELWVSPRDVKVGDTVTIYKLGTPQPCKQMVVPKRFEIPTVEQA
jgi:hypothetical protein